MTRERKHLPDSSALSCLSGAVLYFGAWSGSPTPSMYARHSYNAIVTPRLALFLTFYVSEEKCVLCPKLGPQFLRILQSACRARPSDCGRGAHISSACRRHDDGTTHGHMDARQETCNRRQKAHKTFAHDEIAAQAQDWNSQSNYSLH